MANIVWWIYMSSTVSIYSAWWIYIYITLGIYALQIAYICLVKTKSMLVNVRLFMLVAAVDTRSEPIASSGSL